MVRAVFLAEREPSVTARKHFLIPCITSNLQPKTPLRNLVSTDSYAIM